MFVSSVESLIFLICFSLTHDCITDVYTTTGVCVTDLPGVRGMFELGGVRDVLSGWTLLNNDM